MKTTFANSRVYAVLAALALTQNALAAPPGVRYVRADAPAGGDGLSWPTAYNDLRAALITAGSSGGAVTELWVKQGTYLPGSAGSTDKTQTFTLVNDVGVYGGFAGTETERGQRDPAAHVTTLNGLLGGTTHVFNVVIGAGNAGTVLDGFTITGGVATSGSASSPGIAGGGIRITGSPTIRGCIITGNSTGTLNPDPHSPLRQGGGVYSAAGSAATFTDCVIANNFTNSSAGIIGGPGGGLAAESCTVTLTRCVIDSNRSGDGVNGPCGGGFPIGVADGGPGGGLYFKSTAALVRDCTIEGNATGNGGPGIGCGGGPAAGRSGGNGGAIYATNSTVLVVNGLLVRNRTGGGGSGTSALGAGSRGGNGGNGAGVYSPDGSLTLVNCTVVDNVPGVGGPGGGGDPPAPSGIDGVGSGIYGVATTQARNSIVYDGVTEVVGPVVISYSDVQGGYPGAGNIDAYPQFIDAAGGNYRLLDTSPCIDAGDSLSDIDPITPGTQPLPATDLDGLPRRVDIASVPDTGVGAPVVDMGAYEVQNPCAADLNGDAQVDFSDYLIFLNLYDALDPAADFNHDGQVDFADYLEFLNHYDAGC